MTKRDTYRKKLASLHDWEPYLLATSGLPGPRGNIELAQTAADLGSRDMFEEWLTNDAQVAPTNDPHEFLAFCGAVGLGRLLAEGENDVVTMLQRLANDPRWRMREAVVMALERLGETNMRGLLAIADTWITGTMLEQRAVIAAICHPHLMREIDSSEAAVRLLDKATNHLLIEIDRHAPDVKTLRQGLGYCWSIVIVANPNRAKPAFELWLACDDRDIRWLVKSNLHKARLVRAEPEWVETCLAQLATLKH